MIILKRDVGRLNIMSKSKSIKQLTRKNYFKGMPIELLASDEAHAINYIQAYLMSKEFDYVSYNQITGVLSKSLIEFIQYLEDIDPNKFKYSDLIIRFKDLTNMEFDSNSDNCRTKYYDVLGDLLCQVDKVLTNLSNWEVK